MVRPSFSRTRYGCVVSTEALGVSVQSGLGRFLSVFSGGSGFWDRSRRRQRTNPRALMRREQHESDAVLREQFEGLRVDGGFRKPHAFRFTPEAIAKVGNAPANLRDAIAGRGQRQDEVVVDLRHGRAVAGVTFLAAKIGVDDGFMHLRRVLLQPGEQRGPEVEAHPGIVVEDADDLVLLIDDAGRAIGRVALRGDALVPVVPRGCGILRLDGLEPRILARWLIEVAVDADGFFGAAHG